MFRFVFKTTAVLGATAGVAYLAKPSLEDRYQTNKPSADLKGSADASKTLIESSGYSPARVSHYEGDYFSAFKAEGQKQPGVLGKVTGAEPQVKSVSQVTLFNHAEFKCERDEQSVSLSARYKK